MMHDEIEQGSSEWHALRLGKVTASRVSDVIAKTKTGWGAGRANYAAELISERMTGVGAEKFTNAAMDWGSATEAEARAAYTFYSGNSVRTIAFVDHPSIAMSGASPDGLIGDDGLVEIKCPNTATHIDTLLRASIPGKYISQMQWQMACAERTWCDFVSYDPRLPEELRLFVKRVERDQDAIGALQTEIRRFLSEVEGTVSELQRRYGARPVIESVAIPATVAAGDIPAAFPSPAAPYSEATI